MVFFIYIHRRSNPVPSYIIGKKGRIIWKKGQIDLWNTKNATGSRIKNKKIFRL